MSVTAADGFVAAGGSAGIKAGGVPDVAVVATDDGRAVPAAGVFTANLAAAAPVQVSRAHLATTAGRAAGVILTSGNANAATGKPGREAALQLCTSTALGIGAAPEEILVCQTGLIGIPFPLESVHPHVRRIVEARAGGPDAGAAAARAIMTTDTVEKVALARGNGITVGAMAKGAAMLAPHMATMLALCTTDAAVDAGTLQTALRAAVDASFNAMTVDGCTSTNDTVLVLASGRGATPSLATLTAALSEVCLSLAEQMVDDAEGAPGRPQGGGLHAGAVLPQRRGPLLGSGGERARLGRRGVRHRRGVGGLRRRRGVRRRRGGGARRGGAGGAHGGTARRDQLRPRVGARVGRRAGHRSRVRLHRREPDDVVTVKTS
jgi:glutamate N-acetyltransferase/amino-acid N-acetyltransferase